MQREFMATLDWVRTALTDKDKGKHWQRWQREIELPSQLLRTFFPSPDLTTMTHLPVLSFVLHIPFKLQKPYLSKDERDFHLLDNPVRKEKVFQTPMVASTGWKGALRAALWQLGYKEEHEVTVRLLGNPRESEEQKAGRLHFFSTFFEQIGLEVINPHDRKTGVGARGPILMECVPQGTKGELVLLYVPFGPIQQDENQRRAEVAEDLRMLARGIQAMLTIYGFGAKTSSGFGTAADRLAGEGKLVVRAKLDTLDQPTNRADELEGDQVQADIENFVERFGLDEFPYWTNEELDQSSWGTKRQSKYKRLRARHPDWDEKNRVWGQPEESEPTPTATPPVTDYIFRTLSELCEVAQQVAAQLQGGGEA